MIIKTASNPYEVISQGEGKPLTYHALSKLPKWKRSGYVFRTNKEFTAKLRLTSHQGENGMVQVQDLNTGNRYWMMPGLVAHLTTSGQFVNGVTEGRWTTEQTGHLYHIVKL